MPPITTIARSSPEKATVVDSAAARRWSNTSSAPASPVTVADSTNAASLYRSVS